VSAKPADGDVRAALELCTELLAAPDLPALQRRTVHALARLLHTDAVCWYDWSPDQGRVAVTPEPEEAAPGAFVAAVALPVSGRLACLAAYRTERDFTSTERERLQLVRSALLVALQRVVRNGVPPPLPSGLTPREAEVLAALAEGATPHQIARELHISPRTVHKHLEHVYRKLGVSHRGAATATLSERA
jgi:DNA-binding CsgD family transcriptional regulator